MNTNPVSLPRVLLALALGALVLPCFAQEEPRPFPLSSTDEVDAAGRLPQLTTRVQPDCPRGVLAAGAEEDVWIAFVVDKQGTPTKVRAFFSHHAELEPLAEAAVRKWKFTPGFDGTVFVNTQMVVPVHFARPKA